MQGVDGAQGVQGNQGPPGVSTIIIGTKATVADLPPASTVNVGDGYIVSADECLYTSDGTTWHNVGQIVGPPGPQGIQGVQGQQGPSGVVGVGAATQVGVFSASGVMGASPDVTYDGTYLTAPNIHTGGSPGVLAGGIVRVNGGVIDLWTDGHIYFAGQTVSIYGTANLLKCDQAMQLGGPLTLPADPTTALQAATKQYADLKWTRWTGTQAAYNAIVTKDPNTLYVVVG